ncbi:MAG: hypothetical protein IJK78_02230 [Bacteroidales bacterium]|nr:hypothetical protein [Bacteroidales bacterium]
MKLHPIIHIKFLCATLFVLLTLSATAQFKKPITSPRDRVGSSDAKWNVGLIGGANLTMWPHFSSPESSNWFLQNYKTFDSISPFTQSMGYFGGIGVERMLKSNLSVGLNVVYAQHNVKLGYLDDHFPYAWDTVGGNILFGQIVKSFTANYRTLEAYVPLTYYIGLASTKNIKPYVYFAPRISYVLPIKQNKMTYSASYLDTIGAPIIDPITHDTMVMNNQVPFNVSTFRKLNIGGTIGVGSLFRFDISNYYLLVKFDISANMYAISTFKKGQIINEEFNHLRYSASAYATLTFMLPIKKPLQDACIRWGKYN